MHILCAYTDQKLAQHGQKNSMSVLTTLTTFWISGFLQNASCMSGDRCSQQFHKYFQEGIRPIGPATGSGSTIELSPSEICLSSDLNQANRSLAISCRKHESRFYQPEVCWTVKLIYCQKNHEKKINRYFTSETFSFAFLFSLAVLHYMSQYSFCWDSVGMDIKDLESVGMDPNRSAPLRASTSPPPPLAYFQHIKLSVPKRKIWFKLNLTIYNSICTFCHYGHAEK